MASIVPHLLPEDAAPERKRWTSEEFARFAADGTLGDPSERFELLGGEILKKLGQNEPHISALRLAAAALRLAFGAGYDVSQQIPLKLGESDVPEPDLTVLRGSARDFDGRPPRPEDVALLVEIADSRLDTARGAKVEIYARHGIQEYWIVDLRSRTLEVRRGPIAETGKWTETKLYLEETSGTLLELPGKSILVSDLLPRL